MALQIWLPLNKNGDLGNKGLANVTVTNNGATYNSNGKIGGCYKVNGVQLSIPSASYMEMKSGKQFSFACWAKGATSSGWFIACLGWEIQFLTGHINVYPGGSSNGRDSKFSGATAADLWRHIAFTWDGSNLILYVDGNALNTSTFNASYNISSNINFCYQGERYLNDIRIYDHCLTPQEVKEISRGLVLHYPLNEDFNLNKTSNIIIYPEHQYYFTTTLKKSGSPTYCYSAVHPFDIDNKFIFHHNTLDGYLLSSKTILTQPLNPGDTVIYCQDLSNWITTSNNYYYHVAITGYKDSHGRTYPEDYTQDAPAFGTYSSKTNINKTNNTITLNSAFTGQSRPAGTVVYQSTEGGTYWYPFSGTASNYDDWKVHEMTFYPKDINRLRYARTVNISSLYSTMKDTMLRDNDMYYIKDSSGYNNNGTITGTLTTNTDTPRYDKSAQIISGATISHPLCIKEPEWTCSCWIYPTSFSSYTYLNNLASGMKITHGTSSLLYINENPAYYKYSHTFELNKWQHVVFVFKHSTRYMAVYKNGVKDIATGPSGGTVPALSSTITLFTGFTGYVSDYREYCTALSEDDVKALYQEAAFIDHKGNIGCYLFYEDADSQITKTGQVKTEEFEEISDLTDGVAKVYELKIECNQLIEI